MSPTADALTSATGSVREMVAARRHRGLKAAIGEVARMLGVSDRRVRAFEHGEVRQVLADEWLRIEREHRAEIATRLRQVEHEAATLRARLGERPLP